jgi:alanine dehydrogenase
MTSGVQILSAEDVEAAADRDELRESMGTALRDLAAGVVVSGERYVIPVGNHGALGFMPAHAPAARLLGVKIAAVMPANAQRGLDLHQGSVLLLDAESGVVLAMLDASSVTALRTAAVSAWATARLSRPDATRLALIGAGRQAWEHVRAIVRVRPIKDVVVWSRTSAKANELLTRVQALGISARIVSTARKAAGAGDIVVACTASQEALFSTDDLSPGAHLNAIGACRPGQCEVEFRNRPGLAIYLDSSAACDLEADELRLALATKRLAPSAIVGEIGQEIRPSERDGVTVFKSVGLGIEDLFAAETIRRRAKHRGSSTAGDFYA